MKPVLRFEEKGMDVAHLGEESSVPDLSGEVIMQNQLSFELDEEDEIYEGYGKVKNAYPYRLRNGYRREISRGKVKTAILENKNLKALFLLEYGGRLWELWDKKSGRNLLYTNDVLLFGNLAVRGAWFSGGVEWNMGVIGHTPFTTEKIYTARTEDEQGNPVLRMYEYERIRNITYQMDFWLEEESEFLNCRMRVVNENSDVVPMYWWSNIAVPEFEGGQIHVPAKQAFTNRDMKVYKVDIPMVNGIDVTKYNDIPKSVDYFFDIPSERSKFIANTDKDGFGLLHFSTARLRSRKLFSWGHLRASDHWQEFLTRNAGRYIEMQAGLGKTQYGCIPMAPHTAWEWMEQYGPVIAPGSRIEEELGKRNLINNLEQKLKDTKNMALKPAEIVEPGSGYGVLGIRGNLTAHLEFVDTNRDYEEWKIFLDGGKFPSPNPDEKPMPFLNTEESQRCLEEAVQKTESENWNAHYQYGVRCYIDGRHKKAGKAFEKSLELCENPWALHGLACVARARGRYGKAAKYILQGMNERRTDESYLKEGFQILLDCGAYKELQQFYKKMEKAKQQNTRLKFSYIVALHNLGKDKKAYELLEENGGLVLDDMREGEDSIEMLWSELYESLYQKIEEVPYRYSFKAFQ